MSRMSESDMLRRREEYLSLKTDQQRADYLWNFRHGGAVLGLSPDQYPKCAPRHKRCPVCGGIGRPKNVTGNRFDTYDWIIECVACQRSTKKNWSVWNAWMDWDDGKVDNIDGQMTIFDFIGG